MQVTVALPLCQLPPTRRGSAHLLFHHSDPVQLQTAWQEVQEEQTWGSDRLHSTTHIKSCKAGHSCPFPEFHASLLTWSFGHNLYEVLSLFLSDAN